MKKTATKLISLLLALLLISGASLCGFAQEKTSFDPEAYATVVTASDFQQWGTDAFDRFGNILTLAEKDGLDTPASVLIGGDYSMVLFDNAVPGIGRIRNKVLSLYPEAVPESIVCIQGNHDNPKKEFAETGFYDMGAFCLYVINEDDFPWKQSTRSDETVKALAADIESKLDNMITGGDFRPVIVITHVPLHHTNRNSYGDNMYSSYIFNVLNEKAGKLDIIFVYGHNHSGKYDDYIGGSVNFLKAGDTIRIPLADKAGEDCYTEETLNFTYTNCGYVGNSSNTDSATSTSALTVDFIQFTQDKIKFVRYSEDGLFTSNEVSKLNPGSEVKEPSYPALDDNCMCHSENPLVKLFCNIFSFFCKIFGITSYCVCGKSHF